MNSGVYTITNLKTKKIYLGCTDNFKSRFQNHKSQLKRNVHGNKHLQKAWNKYGESHFKFEILVNCTVDLLASEESYWANMLDCHNPKFGYNIKSTTPDTKRLTTSDKIRISNKLKEMNIRPILMLNLKGEILKEFSLVSDAAAYLGNIQPSVIHRVLCGKRKRYKNYLFVYKDNFNSSINLPYKDKKAKKVLQYDIQGNFIKEFESTMSVQRELGISNSSISGCCIGRKSCNTAGGFIWKYKN